MRGLLVAGRIPARGGDVPRLADHGCAPPAGRSAVADPERALGAVRTAVERPGPRTLRVDRPLATPAEWLRRILPRSVRDAHEARLVVAGPAAARRASAGHPARPPPGAPRPA